MLLIAAAALLRPFPGSSSLIEAEKNALQTLLQITEAETAFHTLSENQANRYAGLGELIGRADDVGLQLPKGSRFLHRARSLVSNNYCFTIYLASESGDAVHTYLSDTRTDFFLLYAWPLKHGSNGRRIFVATNEDPPRYWENPVGSFAGLEAAPPARLSSAPKGKKWPVTGDRPRWFEGLRWKEAK